MMDTRAQASGGHFVGTTVVYLIAMGIVWNAMSGVTNDVASDQAMSTAFGEGMMAVLDMFPLFVMVTAGTMALMFYLNTSTPRRRSREKTPEPTDPVEDLKDQYVAGDIDRLEYEDRLYEHWDEEWDAAMEEA